MPIKRYKPEQIVTMLRQIEVSNANGKTTPQACKEAGITMQTFYRWMGMTCFSSKWILSHSTWYKFSRSGQSRGGDRG